MGGGDNSERDRYRHFYLADATRKRNFSRRIVNAIALNLAASLGAQVDNDELFLVIASPNCPEIALLLLALGCPLLNHLRRKVALVDSDGTSADVADRLSRILPAATGKDSQTSVASALFFTTPESVEKIRSAAKDSASKMGNARTAEVEPVLFSFGGTDDKRARAFESLLHVDKPPSLEDVVFRLQNFDEKLGPIPKIYLIDESRGGIVVSPKPVVASELTKQEVSLHKDVLRAYTASR